jgi:hypothetical protein
MSCLFPIINNYSLKRININKYPWGWVSQKSIKKIIANSNSYKYQPNCFNSEINNKILIEEEEFNKGCRQGYKMIYFNFLEKKNFVKTKYTTPQLSLALNYISRKAEKQPKKLIDFYNLESKILTSWIEIGQANTNQNVVGILDLKLYKQELKNSNIGDCWEVYTGPLKQKVTVLYKNDTNYDVWEWEKCLMKQQEEWTVSNINEILK